MCLGVCMCVRGCVCLCVCVSVRESVGVSVRESVSVSMCVCVCVCLCVCVSVCVCVGVCALVWVPAGLDTEPYYELWEGRGLVPCVPVTLGSAWAYLCWIGRQGPGWLGWPAGR